MALLNDDLETFAKFLFALSQWHVSGYVDFNERSQKWIWANLGCNPALIGEMMYDQAAKGGRVKRIKERGNPDDYPTEFHDDIILDYNRKRVYVETVFHDHRDKEWCRIEVVNVHWAKK